MLSGVPEVGELRLERRVITAPAGDEEQLPLAAASSLVIKPHAIDFRVWHDEAIIPRCHGQGHWPGQCSGLTPDASLPCQLRGPTPPEGPAPTSSA